MTYRQWMKFMKKSRVAAVPDIRGRLPLSVEVSQCVCPRMVVLRRSIGAVAAVAVLVAAIGCGGWWMRGGDTHTPAVSVPSGAIPLHTSVKSVTMLHSGMPSELINTVNGYVGARVLEIMHGCTPPEHTSCHGVYYDMEREEYFCATHAVASALKQLGKSTNNLLVHYYHPVYKRIVFTCADSARTSYVYDIVDETLHRLPVSLYHCPLLMSALLCDHPYVLLHKMGGDRDDIYLINLVTAELTYVLKDSKGDYIYTPMDDSRLTTDGKYVYFTLMKGDGETVNSPARTSVVYEVATGQSRTFIGEIWEEVEGTTRLLIKDPDGFAVYDMASGEKVRYAEAGLPKHYDYYTKQTDVYTDFDYRLLVCNRVTGEEILLTEQYIVASAQVGQYLYYYVRGEDRLRVRDMTSGTEEYLPLETDLVQETESEKNKDLFLRFQLWSDEKREEIWLYYSVTEIPREDAETIRQEQENYPSTHLDKLRDAGQFTSIAALEPLLRQFPENIIAYEGEGFLYLDYTPLTRWKDDVITSGRLIALEDYVSNQFYTIDHQNRNIGSSFSFQKDGTLSDDAARDTRTMLHALNIPIRSAERDYRSHIANDPQTKMQAKLAELSGDRVRAYNFCYTLHRAYGYAGARLFLEGEKDLQELYAFIDFTDTLTYKKQMDYYSEDSQQHYKNHTYIIECVSLELDTFEIYIGRMNGKPFLVKLGCLADLTEEDYTKWAAWMEKQEKKVHLN